MLIPYRNARGNSMNDQNQLSSKPELDCFGQQYVLCGDKPRLSFTFWAKLKIRIEKQIKPICNGAFSVRSFKIPHWPPGNNLTFLYPGWRWVMSIPKKWRTPRSINPFVKRIFSGFHSVFAPCLYVLLLLLVKAIWPIERIWMQTSIIPTRGSLSSWVYFWGCIDNNIGFNSVERSRGALLAVGFRDFQRT